MRIRRTSLLAGLMLSSACSSQIEPESTSSVDGSANDVTTIDVADHGDATTSTDVVDETNRNDAGASFDAAKLDATNRDADAVSTPDSSGRSDGFPASDGTSDGVSSRDSTVRNDAVIDVGNPDAPHEGGIASCVGAVDGDFLRDRLAKLSGATPVQIGNTTVTISERNSAANRQLARQFLTAEYQALGFTVTEHAYATGVNLIASKAGVDAKYLIVSAHYDSIRDTVAGADDDGSGVIAGLAIARSLQGCSLDHGLRIVAFDEEEDGLIGSKAYVSKLQSGGELADLVGDVQLEMLGYHTKMDGGFLLVDCKSQEGDRPESKFLNDAVLGAIARGGLALEPHDSCTSSSDHSPFWTAGAAAIVYSQEFFFSGADSTPCYHKDCDKLDQINFDYFSKLTTMSVLLTADLVGAR